MTMQTITDTEAMLEITQHPALALVVADHEIRDSKDRKVGGYARIATWGEQIAVILFATRNGAAFGASPTKRSAIVDTLELAIAAAEKALAAQGKRYAKKAAANQL